MKLELVYALLEIQLIQEMIFIQCMDRQYQVIL